MIRALELSQLVTLEGVGEVVITTITVGADEVSVTR